MHIDLNTIEGQRWAAQYLDSHDPDESFVRVLHDEAYRCADCDEPFSTQRDICYGNQLCIDCASEAGENARCERVYGREV